ncbi:hypothetical protein TNCV_3810431 [Trichonephila clavipes]|nr:hypothetical protein TNCV_3810431 [Trichonephila clavipes]
MPDFKTVFPSGTSDIDVPDLIPSSSIHEGSKLRGLSPIVLVLVTNTLSMSQQTELSERVNEVKFTSFYKTTRVLLTKDLVILNHGQVMRVTSVLELLSPTFHTAQDALT